MYDFQTWREMKTAGQPIVALTAYDYQTAQAIEAAGVDLILVGDSLGMVVLGHEDTTRVRLRDVCHHVKAVARARPRVPIVADMPFLTFGVDVAETVRNARKLIRAGARAVKPEGGRRIAAHIEALIANGIPVVGHLGLYPQRILALGSYKVAGRTAPEARRLLADARLLDSLGVVALVLESIPEKLGETITRGVSVPTIGIGAGRQTDGQILVVNDLLGMSDPKLPRPRFVRRFAEVFGTMTEGIRAYAKAVRGREFPGPANVYFPRDRVRGRKRS